MCLRPARVQFHSITLKSRLTVMSYEMALLSSVSATYTLLCLIDAAVDEALRPHAVVTWLSALALSLQLIKWSFLKDIPDGFKASERNPAY